MCSCEERFKLFFLSHRAPGAQLWFQPHLCVCSSHRSLLQRWPEHTSSSGWKEPRWRWGPACCPGWGGGDGGRGSNGRGAQTASSQSPPSCPWRQGPPHEERGCTMATPPFARGASLLWQSGLPPQAFLVVELLTPLRLSPLSQQQSPPQVCSPNPTFWHPAPVCTCRHPSQAGAHRGAVARTICIGLTVSCLPQTSCRALL